jgi:hypothetical protein
MDIPNAHEQDCSHKQPNYEVRALDVLGLSKNECQEGAKAWQEEHRFVFDDVRQVFEPGYVEIIE